MDLPEPCDIPRQTDSNLAASRAVHNGNAESAEKVADWPSLVEPPARLSSAEAEVWRETVASVRPNWFQGCAAALEIFCRAVVIERRLASLVSEADREDGDFAALIRMHRSEAMLVANLAGTLRLTVRATRDRGTSKFARGSRAWGLSVDADGVSAGSN